MSLPQKRGLGVYTTHVSGLPSANFRRASSVVDGVGIYTNSAKGESTYTATGFTSFIVPPNVRYISAVCVGAGGPVAAGALGGAGGGCAWRNRIEVTPGETLTLVVNTIWSIIRRGKSSTSGEILCGATAGTVNGTVPVPGAPLVGQGGIGGTPSADGGAGAGGYMGGGGTNAQSVSGGGGGGGGTNGNDAGGGGGVGLTGLTTAFTFASGSSGAAGGGAGVGGNNGTSGVVCTVCVGCPPTPCTTYYGGNGGNYGGGAGGGNCVNGSPGAGGIRIIWPGETRNFPYNAA